MNRYLKKTILCLLILGLFAGLWGCAYRPRPAKTGEYQLPSSVSKVPASTIIRLLFWFP